jgi:ATP-dependent RNA helicase RhlE
LSFTQLGLRPELLRAIEQAGYDTPTPIQRDALPPVLEGRDLLGCAQTGTGKTAAFALPILHRLFDSAGEEPAIQALVLTPTRELAAQIGQSFATYGRHLDLWHTTIFGGVSDKPQIAELRRGVDTLIATPGRLLDLIGRGEVDLSRVRFFVLDEADRMLDMGFLPDVRRITARLPKSRQTLLFSATMPEPIRELSQTLLSDPLHVSVTPVSSATPRVDQRVYLVDKANKPKLLRALLHDSAMERVLVFSRTKHGANKIVKGLERDAIAASAIHGNKSQAARTRALEGFRRGDIRVLVATDLAARGLDVSGISHVINFDLPEIPETYVHRIGRTGRASAAGIALSLCDIEEQPRLTCIERLIGHRIHCETDHAYPATTQRTPSTSKARRANAGHRRPRGPARRSQRQADRNLHPPEG